MLRTHLVYDALPLGRRLGLLALVLDNMYRYHLDNDLIHGLLLNSHYRSLCASCRGSTRTKVRRSTPVSSGLSGATKLRYHFEGGIPRSGAVNNSIDLQTSKSHGPQERASEGELSGFSIARDVP